MPSMPRMPAFRTPGSRLLLASLAAVLAVAAPATALLGLPIALPAVEQHVDTPFGPVDASAGEQGAGICYDLATPAVPVPALPALPALPSLPLPVPIPAVPALPALPTPSAATNACVAAGLDGASADVGADAAGIHVGTGIQADSPVPMDQVESTVGEAQSTAGSAAGAATGFFEDLVETLFGWL